MIRVVFFGTSEESTYALKALVDDPRFEVVASVTQPPRSVGRDQTMRDSDVATIACEHGITTLTPERPIDILDDLRSLKADMFVV
ncbi:MAG: methionyl-tRNA formyltransferase, partial [Patescibacteria group bacterium]